MTAWRQLRGDGAFELRFGGGINERDDFNISLDECTEGANFLLDQTANTLTPRPPQDLLGTAPNAAEITGILQLIERDDTVTQLLVAGSVWYDWNGASIYSDVTPPLFTSGTGGSRMRGTYWSLDDILVVTNIDLNTPLYKWDGTTAARLKTTLTSGTTKTAALTCSGSLATATVTTHGYSTGDLVTIAGANETEYNGEQQVTVTGADTFTYTMVCSTTPATGTITADRGPELKAKFSVVHDHRVWLFNVTADNTATPHMILASAFEDVEDYDNSTRGTSAGLAANDAFFILSPDGRPINGAVEFFATLIISTEEGKLFKLTGSDATDYTFEEYYPGSSAQGEESMVNIGNDIVFFRKGKAVEGLVATDRSGDISTDDLSFWIPDSIKLAVDPIIVYDQDQQKIYFFDDNLGGVLVLDKEFLLSGKSGDSGQLSPWSFYSTIMTNAFSTKAAVQVRKINAVGKDKTVVWGDSSGNIYDMNGTVGGGDGGTQPVALRRKTKVITEMDTNNELMLGRLEYKRTNAITVELAFNWMDEYNRAVVEVPLKGSFGLAGALFWNQTDNYWNETDNYWSSGNVVDDRISTLGFSVPGKGSGFTLELQVSDVSTYMISRILA